MTEYGENVPNGMYLSTFYPMWLKANRSLTYLCIYGSFCSCFLRFHSIKVVIYLSYQFNSISRFRDGRGMGQFLFLIIYAG